MPEEPSLEQMLEDLSRPYSTKAETRPTKKRTWLTITGLATAAFFSLFLYKSIISPKYEAFQKRRQEIKVADQLFDEYESEISSILSDNIVDDEENRKLLTLAENLSNLEQRYRQLGVNRDVSFLSNYIAISKRIYQAELEKRHQKIQIPQPQVLDKPFKTRGVELIEGLLGRSLDKRLEKRNKIGPLANYFNSKRDYFNSMLQKISYTPRDVEIFVNREAFKFRDKMKIKVYYRDEAKEVNFFQPIGFYISLLINNLKQPSILRLKPPAAIDYLGWRMDKDHIIIVEGNICNSLGYHMKTGTILVKGDVCGGTGDSMSGGKIIIEGNVGNMAGLRMKGGKIYIRGNAGLYLGKESSSSGEIHISGNFEKNDPANNYWMKDSCKAKIYHKGRLTHPK